MTKSLRVALFFIMIPVFLFSLSHPSHAVDLIRPIPEETEVSYQQPVISKQQPQTYIPSITFGMLLNSITPTPTLPSKGTVLAANTIADFLSQLEASNRQSLQEFFSNNRQLITDNQSPTPYIPFPTLIAGISEIVNNQQSHKDTSDGGPDVTSGTPPRWRDQNQPPVYTGNLIDNPIKTTYVVAVLGDSMIDTLGRDLPHLRDLLKREYPKLSFTLLNYGQGSTDLESGLYRLTNTTKYLGEDYPPLLSFKPDILVVESFAYNHWSGEKYDLDRQWLSLARIIDAVRENSPETKIILAATISPNKDIFGDGKLNWTADLKWKSTIITHAYLQNFINFATSQNYPLADAYHPSLGPDGNGLERYINQEDHLHPSEEGALLFSQKIVEAIKEHHLFN